MVNSNTLNLSSLSGLAIQRFLCLFSHGRDWDKLFIISSLKKGTKFAKRFHNNFLAYNKDLLDNQASECTELILSK